MTRFRAAIIFIIIFSCLHFESNAADVYFNDVYPITNDEVNSVTLGTKLTGRNFKFSKRKKINYYGKYFGY